MCRSGSLLYVEDVLDVSVVFVVDGLISCSIGTRGCGDTIGPPDDEQRAARNMLRNVM